MSHDDGSYNEGPYSEFATCSTLLIVGVILVIVLGYFLVPEIKNFIDRILQAWGLTNG